MILNFKFIQGYSLIYQKYIKPLKLYAELSIVELSK